MKNTNRIPRTADQFEHVTEAATDSALKVCVCKQGNLCTKCSYKSSRKLCGVGASVCVCVCACVCECVRVCVRIHLQPL